MKSKQPLAILLVMMLSVCALSAKATSVPDFKGVDTIILTSTLNELGLITQAPGWGKSKAGDAEAFFKGLPSSAKCSDTAYKALDVRVQSGLIRCRENKSAAWDNFCTVQTRAGKSKDVSGATAKALLDIIKEAGAPSKTDAGAKVYEMSSVDCNMAGWQACKGMGTCRFP